MVRSTALLNTAAQLACCALSNLFPGSLLLGTSSHDFWFSCDLILSSPLDDAFIPLIEEKMRSIAKSKEYQPTTQEMIPSNAATLLLHQGQPFLAERVETVENSTVHLLKMGNFYNIAPPVFLEDLQAAIHFKITHVEKMDEGFRIKGTVATTKQELKDLLKGIAAAQKNDFKKNSEKPQLFVRENRGALESWQPDTSGWSLQATLASWLVHSSQKQGFISIQSPPLIETSVLRRARILDWIGECEIANKDFAMLPSLCLYHTLFYGKNRYNTLKISEIGKLYRSLPSWEQEEILYTQATTIDQASLFCLPQDLTPECISSLLFIDKTLKILGFGYRWGFAYPQIEKKDKQNYRLKCAQAFEEALHMAGLPYFIDERLVECATLTAYVTDKYGRTWVGPTLRENVRFVRAFALRSQSGEQPILLERTLFDSFERWIAILAQQHSEGFPLWLAPEQVRVIPAGIEQLAYAKEVASLLTRQGFRVAVDSSQEPSTARMRRAAKQQVPYILTIGEEELTRRMVTLRSERQSLSASKWHLEALMEHLHREVAACEIDELNPK